MPPKTFVARKVKVPHSTTTKWFKSFHSGCKNFDDQVRSGRTKTVISEAIFQAIEVNLISSTWRVSGEFGISQFSAVSHLHDLGKGIWSGWIASHITKILQNLLLTQVQLESLPLKGILKANLVEMLLV